MARYGGAHVIANARTALNRFLFNLLVKVGRTISFRCYMGIFPVQIIGKPFGVMGFDAFDQCYDINTREII